jgi:mannose-6-phosphate isomerase-like protein (cupin superfamily)
MIKNNFYDVGGSVVKDNETYLLKDNTTLNNLVLSSTKLHPNKETTGHNHVGQEEVYFFISGFGKMQLDDDKFAVKAGDVILIEDGVFHKVFNESDTEALEFVCVFDGRRNH